MAIPAIFCHPPPSPYVDPFRPNMTQDDPRLKASAEGRKLPTTQNATVLPLRSCRDLFRPKLTIANIQRTNQPKSPAIFGPPLFSPPLRVTVISAPADSSVDLSANASRLNPSSQVSKRLMARYNPA